MLATRHAPTVQPARMRQRLEALRASAVPLERIRARPDKAVVKRVQQGNGLLPQVLPPVRAVRLGHRALQVRAPALPALPEHTLRP